MAQHVAGDPDAFGELFRRHRDRLWSVAMRTLGDPEEAADAVSELVVNSLRFFDFVSALIQIRSVTRTARR